jgi:hypothetical protein
MQLVVFCSLLQLVVLHLVRFFFCFNNSTRLVIFQTLNALVIISISVAAGGFSDSELELVQGFLP